MDIGTIRRLYASLREMPEFEYSDRLAAFRLKLLRLTERLLAAEVDSGKKCAIMEAEERFNPNHDPKTGRFIGKVGGSAQAAFDSSGKPYKYPALKLEREEYGKVMHEINTVYHARFEGKSQGNIRLAIDNGYYCYRFEIHGFDSYNIFDKEEY